MTIFFIPSEKFSHSLQHFGCFTDYGTLSVRYARGYTRDIVFLLRSFGFLSCFDYVEILTPSSMILVRYWLAFLNQFFVLPAALFWICNSRFDSNSNLGCKEKINTFGTKTFFCSKFFFCIRFRRF